MVPFRSSANISISSQENSANAAWLGAECVISQESITVRVFNLEQIHLKTNIQELRWVKWPLPYAVVISKSTHGFNYRATIQLLRWSRLRKAFEDHGYTFTAEVRRCSIAATIKDNQKYGTDDNTTPPSE
jgi:hypothetical protein